MPDLGVYNLTSLTGLLGPVTDRAGAASSSLNTQFGQQPACKRDVDCEREYEP